MTSLLLALLLVGGLIAGDATAETADCRAQLSRQDEQCQGLAEKLAEACPSGTNIKETAQCRELSSQIANTCTRKPCAPPRKAKRGTSRSKGMAGMGTATPKASKKASKPAAKTSK